MTTQNRQKSNANKINNYHYYNMRLCYKVNVIIVYDLNSVYVILRFVVLMSF